MKIFNRRVNQKIKEELTLVERKYQLAEQNLIESLDTWVSVASSKKRRTKEEIIFAGDALADAAHDFLSYYPAHSPYSPHRYTKKNTTTPTVNPLVPHQVHNPHV